MSIIPMYNDTAPAMARTSFQTSFMPESTNYQPAQIKTKMCFQYTISGFFNINQPIYSPLIATHYDTFWQIKFTPVCSECPDYCSLALFWVRNAKETITGNLSSERLQVTHAYLFVKDTDSGQLIEKKSVNINSFHKRWPGQGWGDFAQRAFLSDRVTYGVEFETVSGQHNEVLYMPLENYPNILKAAWGKQLDIPTGSDVQFNIEGHTLYASSIILSNRSEYFKNMFQGNWCEVSRPNNLRSSAIASNVIEEVTPEDILFANDLKPILPISSSTDQQVTALPPGPYIKCKIDVTDCNFETFKDMLVYLYTDQVPFTKDNDEDQLNLAVEIFSIADKYLISDLREKAMQTIWESLSDDKAAEVLFTAALNWPDLKECVLEYVTTRFNFVRKTETFKRIKSNQSSYPGAGEVFAELLLKLVPDSD